MFSMETESPIKVPKSSTEQKIETELSVNVRTGIWPFITFSASSITALLLNPMHSMTTAFRLFGDDKGSE